MTFKTWVGFFLSGFKTCRSRAQILESFKIMPIIIGANLFDKKYGTYEICAEAIYETLKVMSPVPKHENLNLFALILCWNCACVFWYAPKTRLEITLRAQKKLTGFWRCELLKGDLKLTEAPEGVLKDLFKT